MHKTLLPLLLFFGAFHANAQLNRNTILNFEVGSRALSQARNVSLFANLEPKLPISDHAFLGLRLGLAINTQSYENHDDTRYVIDDKYDNGFLATALTFSYHWHKRYFSRKIALRPFMGVGIGPYLLANSAEVFEVGVGSPEDTFEVPVKFEIGFMLRGGLEFRHVHLGVEYNLVPESNVALADGTQIGTVKNNFLGLFLGFTLLR